MKKLLCSAAVIGLAVAATPALAEDGAINLDVNGHYKGYVVAGDQDDVAGVEGRDVDWLQETELHFTGETTLDNGLTVGFHAETEIDGGDDFITDEAYAYFAGSWGRVNAGNEDGAAYLLQVAAPSADSNVDGIRQFVQPVNLGGTTGPFGATPNFDGFDYDNDLTNDANKLTYLTPVISGFQGGFSYTPDTQDLTSRQGANGEPGGFTTRDLEGVNTDDVAGEYGEAYEVSARYEGAVQNVGFILGGGYTQVELEDGTTGQDDFQEWNVGLDLDFGPFGLGAVYTENNNGSEDDDKNETIVVGADYTTGPFKLGASYFTNDNESIDFAGTEAETDRYTGGVVYTYGPGMSFRGSISYTEIDVDGGDEIEATNVLLGTQINF